MKGGDVRRRDEKHKHLRKSPATCVRLGRHRYLESRTEGLRRAGRQRRTGARLPRFSQLIYRI